ncbi:hypothetical protein BVAD3_04630 [Bacillus velezensis]|nr:hypothetical protein BVAD3_04630 [Bacillus velezensis]
MLQDAFKLQFILCFFVFHLDVYIFETILGILLIIGFKTRITAVLSGAMLIIFALGLTVGTGFKTSLDYSVFSASAGAIILIYF